MEGVIEPLRVFVIEDDPDACDNLRDILELDAHHVAAAHTAGTALSHPELPQTSVVLLDWKLPDATAKDLLPQLQQMAPAAEILVVTGHADLDSAVAALRLGAADYLLKPINPDALRASLRRIARHRHAEALLRQEREFAQTVIETAQSVVLVLDTRGRIVQFNPFLEKLSGYPLVEVTGEDWFETFLPERDRVWIRQLFMEVLEGRPVRGTVNPIRTRAGRERPIAWWATTLKNSRRETMGVLAIGHDVTDLQEAQQRVLQAERLAAIGKAMTGLAHESRNALQRSQAGLEMLTRRLADRADLLELTGRIQKAQDDLHQLYEEVREYAAPIRLQRQPVHLANLLQEVWDDLAAKTQGRQARLHQNNRTGDLTASVDRFGMRQVFRNILENSLAACADPVEIDADFVPCQWEGRPALRITLRDNGPGLSPAVRERIFEEFFTTKTHGTGLGMAICRRIVDTHGGRIEVGTDPGAVICITLPREAPALGEKHE